MEKDRKGDSCRAEKIWVLGFKRMKLIKKDYKHMGIKNISKLGIS